MPKVSGTSRLWTCEQVGGGIHRIRAKAGPLDPFWLLIRSDAHHDSAHCDRAMERRHLEQAVERNAAVLDLGDLFDCMQTRNDPRRALGGKRPEHAERPYLDSLLDDAVDFYAPFASALAVIGIGNHESKIEQHCDIDLVGQLTARLTERTGYKVHRGGYGGWLVVELDMCGCKTTYRIRYHHGSGKGAMMTFGALDSRRMLSWVADADCIATGHTHDHMVLPIARETLHARTGLWEVRHQTCTFVRVGTYKDEHGDGTHGFAVEKNFGPKPLGAVWLKLRPYAVDANGHRRLMLDATVERAT